jgi:hypothetical protein
MYNQPVRRFFSNANLGRTVYLRWERMTKFPDAESVDISRVVSTQSLAWVNAVLGRL